jgi:peptidyl-prolyl isomerase E (cyclophilin E)
MAQSTLVAVGGKGTNPKTTLYVGGLEETVNEATLHAAFLPFGEIKEINIPLDHATGTHRGFGFVEYEEKEDAAAAIDNMNNAELFGRVLKVLCVLAFARLQLSASVLCDPCPEHALRCSMCIH